MYNFTNNTREVSLIGFVYEVEERGWVKGIAISTGDEDYIVDKNEWEEKLRNEIENDVQVSGIVARDPAGRLHIRVTGYELLYKDGEYNLIYSTDDDDF